MLIFIAVLVAEIKTRTTNTGTVVEKMGLQLELVLKSTIMI
jgi:hypothetical protein